MILALDTSCYTTSLALLSKEGELLADMRRVLDVPLGKRGLSQSEALFQHISNLPKMVESLSKTFDFKEITAIGASARPRPIADSYMPVFLGGMNTAITLKSALGVPFLEGTHQEGHMLAGIFASDFAPKIGKKFLMCHFSGGTSEIHAVEKVGEGNYILHLVSATSDLHAGQFVDRIGVALGLSFPTGKALEQLALKTIEEIPKVPTYCNAKDGSFSFSGQETALTKLIEAGISPHMAARIVEDVVARTLKKALTYALEKTGIKDVLLVGGVMSNQWIAAYLKDKLRVMDLYFADAKYASDNAVGIASLTLERLNYIK